MSELTKKLHDAVYKNTIWPNDLMNNLEDDPDYLSINFTSYIDGICGEVIFMDQGKKIITNYYFNKKHFVQKVEMIESEKSYILYDRCEEITKILLELGRIDELEKTINLLVA